MKIKINKNQFFNSRQIIALIAVFFALPMSFTSCNDEAFLEEKVYSTALTDLWYGSAEGIKQGIAGCHTHVRRYWYWGEENQDQICIWLAGLGTDIAYHGEAPNSNRFLCNYTTYLLPSGGAGGQSTVDYHWRYAFELVQKANYVIQGCENLDANKWTKAGQKEAYIAEAKFFRAWAYRHLTSFFGKVPVIDYTIASIKTDFEREPLEKAYALMEADLKAGTVDLPKRGEESYAGGITQGAAWQLLCEVYLAQKKYNDAVAAASHVINDYGYKLVTERFGGKNSVWGTGDVFWDLHADGNQFNTANTEAIWVIPFANLSLSNNYSNHRAGRCWGNAYFRLNHVPDAPFDAEGKLPAGQVIGDWAAFRGESRSGGNAYPGGYTGYSDTLGRGVAWVHPTVLTSFLIWDGNWDNDYRNAKHMWLRDFYYDNPRSAFHGKKINMAEDYKAFYVDRPYNKRDLMLDTCQYIFPFHLKKFDPCNVVTNSGTSGNGDSFKDIYGMRLAETYLSRAEAYIGAGQYQLAVDDINVVRARSNAKLITVAEVGEANLLDYLLDERIRELYGEECRHFVLRRTGKYYERVVKYNNNPANPTLHIQPHHVLWPIPQSEIDINIGNAWEQNPGY